jgi:hypothetical protein
MPALSMGRDDARRRTLAGLDQRVTEAFLGGLAEQGYADRSNVKIEFRWADGQYDRLPALAGELVRHPLAVFAAVGGNQAPRAAMAATSTIPTADEKAAGIFDTQHRAATALREIAALPSGDND